jgi:hypothetical protein
VTDTTWLTAYLGDSYGDATSDQRARIIAAQSAIDARWAEPDLADTRADAFIAAVQVILGDATLEQTAAAWRDLRERERTAHAALTGAIIATAASEHEIARRTGVARDTVRKALGKR